MKQKIAIPLLMAAVMLVGCLKEDTLLDDSIFVPSDGEIAFSSNEIAETKGTIIDGLSELSEMYVYAFYTPSSTWDDEGITYSEFMVNQKLEQSSSSNYWTYSPVKYWPADEDDHISFFAFSPKETITYAVDESSGEPTFSYTVPLQSNEGVDLIAAAQYDLNINNSSVEFDLQHTLTQIILQAKMYSSEGSTLADNETFIINGITIDGLYSTGTLKWELDESDEAEDETRTMSWTLDQTTTQSITAAQGNTLISKDESSAALELDADDYQSVMANDNAIFVMPQKLKATERADGATPTIQVRIRRAYTVTTTDDTVSDIDGSFDTEDTASETTVTQEIIYESSKITIPTTTITEWEMGQAVAINFSFDIDNLDLFDTALTLSSELFDYTDVSVDVDMHSNLYIYSSKSNIEAVTESVDGTEYKYGEFMICTNYDYNLRVPHHREELDGDITSSRGFLFCSDDFNSYTDEEGASYNYDTYDVGSITASDGDTYKMFVPTLLTTAGEEVVYVTEDNLSDYGHTLVTTTNADGSYTYTVGTETIYFGSNGYAYHLNTTAEAAADNTVEAGLYRLLYYGTDNALTPFKYENDTDTGYHEIDLSDFADSENANKVNFKIKIMSGYSFDFSATKTTRNDPNLNLYTSTAIDDTNDNSYGVNKQGSDPVYILRLSVNATHLTAAKGVFDDVIGVEMISNGGGMITQLFSVTLTDPLYTEDTE